VRIGCCHPPPRAAAIGTCCALPLVARRSLLLLLSPAARSCLPEQRRAPLLSLCPPPPQLSNALCAGIPRGTTDARLLPVMHTAHGYALALAALLAASRRLPLGVPARLLETLYAYARKLIVSPMGQARAACPPIHRSTLPRSALPRLHLLAAHVALGLAPAASECLSSSSPNLPPP